MLPPIGVTTETERSELLDYVSRCAEEAADERGAQLVVIQANRSVYACGEEYPTGELVTNEIQNAIIAATDIQTKEPIRVTLEGVESGEPGAVLWAGPQDAGLTLMVTAGIPPEQAVRYVAAWQDPTTGALSEPLPIEQQQAELLRTMLPPDKPDWLLEITDEICAKTNQTLFDKVWQRSAIDRRLRSNLLNTNVDGWQVAYYHWFPREMRCELLTLSPSQVYLDVPGIEDVADMQYAGVDLVLDASRAMRMFPHLSDAIAANAQSGSPAKEAGATDYGAVEIAYKRPTVTIRLFWLRNQPIPMTPEEMAEQGMAPEQPEPVEPPTPEEINPSAEAGMVEEAEPAPAPEPQMRFAIRQVAIIGGRVVEDIECPYPEIPLLHNVNIPLTGKPFGLGEPYRLKGLQAARNSVLRAESEHADMFRHPPSAISQSMKAALGDNAKAYVTPGVQYTIPDELYRQMGGKIAVFTEIPEFSPSLIQMDDRLRREITEASGHTEVLQGRANSQMSGKAIETLQTAAASLIGFKSQRTGDMVQYMAGLILHSIANYTEPDQIARIVSRYPINVLMAILKRAKSIEWDINVVVTSGSGQIIAQKKQQAREDLQLGAITMETYREKAGIDHGLETRRVQDMQAQMADQAMMAPATEAQIQPKENANAN